MEETNSRGHLVSKRCVYVVCVDNPNTTNCLQKRCLINPLSVRELDVISALNSSYFSFLHCHTISKRRFTGRKFDIWLVGPSPSYRHVILVLDPAASPDFFLLPRCDFLSGAVRPLSKWGVFLPEWAWILPNHTCETELYFSDFRPVHGHMWRISFSSFSRVTLFMPP